MLGHFDHPIYKPVEHSGRNKKERITKMALSLPHTWVLSFTLLLGNCMSVSEHKRPERGRLGT